MAIPFVLGLPSVSKPLELSVLLRFPRRDSWAWKGYSWNRVPPAIEEAVRERFAQGWSKSKLAREFHLSRDLSIESASKAALASSRPGLAAVPLNPLSARLLEAYKEESGPSAR